jgi:hypothetical protein
MTEFYDINKLPPEEGMLVFLISMNKIDHGGQRPNDCWNQILHFHPHKVQTSKKNAKVGATFVYSGFLYLYHNKPSVELKQKYMNDLNKHKNGLMKLVHKDPYIIKDAFSFKTWSQFYIDNSQFVDRLKKIQALYKKDKQFQKYVKEDFDSLPKGKFTFDENQINFFLEEFLVFYLIAKGEIELPNKFIQGHEKWILNCYPSKPLKGYIYLHMLNPFKLEHKKNTYENSWYDLEEKKLYNFENIDLEKY